MIGDKGKDIAQSPESTGAHEGSNDGEADALSAVLATAESALDVGDMDRARRLIVVAKEMRHWDSDVAAEKKATGARGPKDVHWDGVDHIKAMTMWLKTKGHMEGHLSQRTGSEFVYEAACLLVQGDSGRKAPAAIIEVVTEVLERLADHLCLLDFAEDSDRRAASAQVIDTVQAVLSKRTAPRRAEFVLLVNAHVDQLRQLDAAAHRSAHRGIARAFVTSAARYFGVEFRELSEGQVLKELLSLCFERPARGKKSLRATTVAGRLSAEVGGFGGDSNPVKAASTFDKAWKAWKAWNLGKVHSSED